MAFSDFLRICQSDLKLVDIAMRALCVELRADKRIVEEKYIFTFTTLWSIVLDQGCSMIDIDLFHIIYLFNISIVFFIASVFHENENKNFCLFIFENCDTKTSFYHVNLLFNS